MRNGIEVAGTAAGFITFNTFGGAGSNFEYAALLTEICLLGNLAKRVDAPIEWDGQNMKVSNLPEANQYVRAEYRNGWSI